MRVPKVQRLERQKAKGRASDRSRDMEPEETLPKVPKNNPKGNYPTKMIINERMEQIIKMRFGVKDGVTHTLEETGKAFGVTRERIRQVEAKFIDSIGFDMTDFSREKFPQLKEAIMNYFKK